MTVEKGRDWGSAGALPEDGVIVRSDAEARAVVTAARRAGEEVPPLGLLGGDLCRTVGGRGDEARLRSNVAARLNVDLGSVLMDGRLHWFVAHLVTRRGWLRGPLFGAFNAQWLGPWDVAPRAHPGDGQLEIVEVTMSAGDRLKARSPARHRHPGAPSRHPHPAGRRSPVGRPQGPRRLARRRARRPGHDPVDPGRA